MPYNFVIPLKQNKPRELGKICTESGVCFRRILEGNHYCSLAFGNRNVECPYISEHEDENLLRNCCYDFMR